MDLWALVMTGIAMFGIAVEMSFFCETWRCSIIMLVYQRVTDELTPKI